MNELNKFTFRQVLTRENVVSMYIVRLNLVVKHFRIGLEKLYFIKFFPELFSHLRCPCTLSEALGLLALN